MIPIYAKSKAKSKVQRKDIQTKLIKYTWTTFFMIMLLLTVSASSWKTKPYNQIVTLMVAPEETQSNLSTLHEQSEEQSEIKVTAASPEPSIRTDNDSPVDAYGNWIYVDGYGDDGWICVDEFGDDGWIYINNNLLEFS